MSHQPEGYSTVSPYLVVNGAQRTMAFLEEVFGARELRRFEDDDRGIIHAEVRIGDTVVTVADATRDWPAIPTQVHVYVPGVDETYRQAVAAGGTGVQEPVQRDDDDRRGGVKGPGGVTWWIATRVD